MNHEALQKEKKQALEEIDQLLQEMDLVGKVSNEDVNDLFVHAIDATRPKGTLTIEDKKRLILQLVEDKKQD